MVDDARVTTSLANLRIDAVTAEAVAALRAAGVRTIVLKGPAVARWLYDQPGERAYRDSDLLVAPVDRRRAQRTLRALGFARGREESWLRRAHAWSRTGAVVDLHTSLFGVDVPAASVWASLSRDTARMEVGGLDVEILSEPARALHVAMHAAQHPFHDLSGEDLERAVARVPTATWEEAARLAAELQADAVMRAGLMRAPRGEALAQELGLSAPPSAVVGLLASKASAPALGYAQIAAADSMRLRLALVLRAIAPRPSIMRQSPTLAPPGPLGLAVAYVSRWIRLARSAPADLRAWRRAQRASPRARR
jgi:hypothetical protein